MTPPRQIKERTEFFMPNINMLDKEKPKGFFTPNQPPAKWIEKKDKSFCKVFTEDNDYEVLIPFSLFEQLQSEARIKEREKAEQDYMEHTLLAVEEARADERKKAIAYIERVKDALIKKECFQVAQIYADLLVGLKIELEQPVEYCKCPSAKYYEQGQICEDCGREGKVESKEERKC